jgi:hypothetical protein
LLSVSNYSSSIYRRNAEVAAASFARKLVPVEVRAPDELDAAFPTWVHERVELIASLLEKNGIKRVQSWAS